MLTALTIACDGDKRIEFHFHTDQLELENLPFRPIYGNNPFVKGTFPIRNPVFPFTCRA